MESLHKILDRNLFDRHKNFVIFAALLAIAAFFRLWQIHILPGGLFPDEAANGLDVNSILQGDRSPFFARGNGREGLFFYLLAISVELFGRGPWQHHIVSALIGIAEVGVTFLLTRRMFGLKTAAFAGFFMATSTWHTVLSRTAFRAIMIPLFTTLTIYFIIRFIQAKNNNEKIYSAFFAGAFFALGFYTYIAYRIMVFVFLALAFAFLYVKVKKLNLLAGMIFFSPKTREYFNVRKFYAKVYNIYSVYKKYIIISAVSFLIFISPLAYYFLTHPGTFIGRSGQVSVFSKTLNKGDMLGTVVDVLDKTAWSFFAAGDLNWRHNISGKPFLPPALSILFLIGLIYALWKSAKYVIYKTNFSDGKYLILTLWFFAMTLPEITTAEGIPHGLRLIGVIPAIFIFPAIIVQKLLSLISKKVKPGALGGGLIFAVVGAYLIIIFSNSYNLYFNFYANSPEAYYAFRSDLTNVSDYINRRDNKLKTYLSLDKFSEQTVLYFTTAAGNPYQLVVPEKSYEVKLNPRDQIIFTQSTLFDAAKFSEYHPRAKLVYFEENKFRQTIMEVFEE